MSKCRAAVGGLSANEWKMLQINLRRRMFPLRSLLARRSPMFRRNGRRMMSFRASHSDLGIPGSTHHDKSTCQRHGTTTYSLNRVLIIGVNHGGMGMHPPRIYGGGWIYYHPPIRMVDWTADKTAACVLLRKQRDMYAFSIFPP